MEISISPQNEIYLSRAIVKVNEKKKALATILNASNQTYFYRNISLPLLPIPTANEIAQIFSSWKFPPTNPNQHSNSNIRESREEKLMKILRLDHLNDEEKEFILKDCLEYSDLFYLEGDQLTCTDLIEHKIPTTDDVPVYVKSYRQPESLQNEVNRQIQEMLDQKIIRESKGPWNAPLVVIPKKLDADGIRKFRICIDYRKLNEKCLHQRFPLPVIEEILDKLSHCSYFSSLDLTSGYWQIKVAEPDIEKTAFSTPTNHYEFLRLPFGLRNAPYTFQRGMNQALLGIDAIAYLDDVIIFASSLEEHSTKLREVFDKFRRHNLKLQPAKCEFLRKEILYLGHTITKDGVKPNREKIMVINDFPRPKNAEDIQSFLGLTGYYRRFISNFAHIAKPLTSLLRKDTQFEWTRDQENSFNKFKKILSEDLLLKYPDYSKEFIVTTDASNFAIGAVLSQGEIGQDLPISFASRTLNKLECNYSTTEKELLAIVWAVKHFRPHIYGKKFKIVTDHRPLTWLFNVKDPNSKLIRWQIKLSEYEYEIVSKEGRKNSNADALSRIQVENNKSTTSPCPINVTQHIKLRSNPNENTYSDFLKFHYTNHDPIIVKEISDSIFTQQNVAIFYPSIVEQVNDEFTENLKEQFNLLDFELSQYKLHDVAYFRNHAKNLFICIYKQNYFDSFTYASFFQTLINLKNVLLLKKFSQISLSAISTKYDRLSLLKIKEIIYYVFMDTNIEVTLCLNTKINLSPLDIRNILDSHHNTGAAGHPGFTKMYQTLKTKFYWRSMKNDVLDYVKSCKSCQLNKIDRHPSKQPMIITTTSSRPFQRISIDIVGPLNITENGNRFLLTIQDDLTKFLQIHAIPNHEAHTVAQKLNEFISSFGIPENILSDNGTEFSSEIIKALTKLYKIRHIFASPYRPQSNASLERTHATLKDYLKHFIQENPDLWDDWIPHAIFYFNSTIHSSTGKTPYELLFGHIPYIPSTLTQNPEFHYTYDDYYDQLKLKLNNMHQIAKEKLIHSKEQSKRKYDKKLNVNTFSPGDLVLIRNKIIRPGISKKLQPTYHGPYKILKVFPNNTVRIQVKRKHITYHTDLLKLYVPGKQNSRIGISVGRTNFRK